MVRGTDLQTEDQRQQQAESLDATWEGTNCEWRFIAWFLL